MAKNVFTGVIEGMYAGVKRVTDIFFHVGVKAEESVQEKNCREHIAYYDKRIAEIENKLQVTKHTNARRKMLNALGFAMQRRKDYELELAGLQRGL